MCRNMMMAAAVLTTLSTHSFAEPSALQYRPTVWVVTAPSGVNVRSSPAIDGMIMRVIPYGKRIKASCKKSSDWCYLLDRHGYVAKGWLKAAR